MPTARGVWENLIAALIASALLAGAAFGISRIDAPIPLWIVFIGIVLALAVGCWFGWQKRYGGELLSYQSDLIGEAVAAQRDVISGNLQISFEDFIERGVLAPARFGLSIEHGEEIRLSVLVLDGETFGMLYEAGHSLGRKDNFTLPKASLAGHALETGELQWSNNVEKDRRWHRHPMADRKRSYRSLASMPIMVGDEPVAVLNVVSSAKGAFLRSDLLYIELLGGFIGLAWALKDDAESEHRLASSQEASASKRKEA